MSSEVSRLRAQIDQENEAAQRALTGISEGSARHSFISARYDRIGEIKDALSKIVGHDEAIGMVVEQLNKRS